MDTASGDEVRVLSIDGVVERPDKQLEVGSGGLGAGSQKGFKPLSGAKSSVRRQKAKPRSAPQRMESAFRGAKTTCGDVLEEIIGLSVCAWTQLCSASFKLSRRHPSKYLPSRRVSSSPEEFARVFTWMNLRAGSALWSKRPPKGLRSPDFVYEVQLLNRSDETAEYCLKHW